MSTACRVIKGGQCEITQEYKGSAHAGIDIVNKGYTLGTIVAHSAGTVVGMRNDCNGFEQGSYGNYVKIKHDNGYYTLYAHGQYNSVKVKNGQKVAKGAELFAMGNTGYSFGGHLHFEVRDANDTKIDPTPYLNSDLPSSKPAPAPSGKHKLGDIVEINGVYVSSTSDKKLKPAKTKGTITRIVNARNPYLLDDGDIGWVNDDCIVESKGLKLGDMVTINGVYQSSMSDNKLRPLINKGTITRIVEGAKNPYLLNDGNIGWINEGCVVSTTSQNSTIHIVKAGESLSTIAAKYNTTWQYIYEKNSQTIGSNPDLIQPGMKLVI